VTPDLRPRQRGQTQPENRLCLAWTRSTRATTLARTCNDDVATNDVVDE